MARSLIVVFSLFLLTSASSAQDSVSTNLFYQDTAAVTTDNTIEQPEDDFTIGLAFLALVGAGFVLACVGIGAALTALAVLIVIALISFGVVTTSVLVGLHQNSFIKGFKTFIILTSAIGTTIVGGFAFWFINKMGDWWPEKFAILCGAAFGLTAGLILCFVALYIFQKLTAYFKKQFG
jgi:hypothetical protein